MHKILLPLAMLFTSFSNHAVTVFYCSVNDIASYSQFPCGADQTEIEVKHGTGESVIQSSYSSSAEGGASNVQSVKSFQLDKKIARYQNRVDLYNKRMTSELNALRKKSAEGNVHSTARAYHQEIAEDIALVKIKYTNRITELHKLILQSEKEKHNIK